MNAYVLELDYSSVNLLLDLERQLKKDILDPYLTWNECLELNEVIKNIDTRIKLIRLVSQDFYIHSSVNVWPFSKNSSSRIYLRVESARALNTLSMNSLYATKQLRAK